MDIGLFIPCYINQYYLKVGIATWKLLKSMGYTLHYPHNQTCCGQPLANSGYAHAARFTAQHFEEIFSAFEVIVAPSASCTLFIKNHTRFLEGFQGKIYELSEFLVQSKAQDKINASFPGKVGILKSCHGLRGLHLGNSSEIGHGDEYTFTTILSHVKDLEIINISRPDDCCGFGGTFCVKEPDLSVKMGKDRLEDFISNGAEVITSTDISCLMHLEGIIKKNKYPIQVMHFSEILCQI